MKSPWKKISSKIVHKNKWYRIRQDKIIQPNGKAGQYNLLERSDGVTIIAMDKKGDIYLIDTFRYTVNRMDLSLPAGGMDSDTPLVAAKRELFEETGLQAKTWKKIGTFTPSISITNVISHVYLATDLDTSKIRPQSDEAITAIYKMSLKDILKNIRSGKITNSYTISAILLLQLKLNK